MASLVFLLEQISPGLYVLFGLGVLWYLRKFIVARREYRATYFELERELSRGQQANALTAIILLVEFAIILYGVQSRVVPIVRAYEADEVLPVAVVDDGVFATPTPAPLLPSVDIDPIGQLGPDDPINQVLATPTLTPTPVGTIVPNPPPAIGCDTPNAFLQVPANGMQVFQPIVIRGTAFVDNFSSYKIEIRGASTFDEYRVLDTKVNPVTEIGELGQFIPSSFEPGEYQFRLTVFDINGMLAASCMVNILITEPVPTPTPIGQ